MEDFRPDNKNKEDKNLKLEILDKVKNSLENSKEILFAKIYGSWLYSEKSIDLDICAIIPSKEGVVESNVYRLIKGLRQDLNKKTKQDIDLVPHTEDEILDLRSTLYYPRYNPSLVSGQDLKGSLNIDPVFDKDKNFDFGDLVAYVLLDNRTICRRQLVRSLSLSESRIFISKILHGPGNALTYYSCKNKEKYKTTPSNLEESLDLFDQVYNLNSEPARKFIMGCKKNFDFEKALKLMEWYENLVSVVLYKKGNYNKFCLSLIE